MAVRSQQILTTNWVHIMYFKLHFRAAGAHQTKPHILTSTRHGQLAAICCMQEIVCNIADLVTSIKNTDRYARDGGSSARRVQLAAAEELAKGGGKGDREQRDEGKMASSESKQPTFSCRCRKNSHALFFGWQSARLICLQIDPPNTLISR